MTVRPLLALLLASLIILSAVAQKLAAREDPSSLCVDAARSAARVTGVPVNVLLAVTLVETGRDRKPWPWTVNVGARRTGSTVPVRPRCLSSRCLTRGRPM